MSDIEVLMPYGREGMNVKINIHSINNKLKWHSSFDAIRPGRYES